MIDLSRRGFLRKASGLIVFPAIVKATSLMPVAALAETDVLAGSGVLTSRLLYKELARVTREALLPGLYRQLYAPHPLLALYEQENAA